MKKFITILIFLYVVKSKAQTFFNPLSIDTARNTLSTDSSAFYPNPFDTIIRNNSDSINEERTGAIFDLKNISADCRLFPNPANNFISFSGFPTYDVTHFSIVNIYGQTVLEDDTQNHSINISELAPGQYFLTLQNKHQKAIKQFIKN